jgi:hypothetical protein
VTHFDGRTALRGLVEFYASLVETEDGKTLSLLWSRRICD